MSGKTAKEIREESRLQKLQADQALTESEQTRLATERAAQESKARAALVNAGNVGATESAVKTDDLPSTETVLFHKLGLKSARVYSVETVNEVPFFNAEINSNTLGKIMALLPMTSLDQGVQLLGVNTSDVSKLLIKVNGARLQALVDANVKAPKAPNSGNGYDTTTVYVPHTAHVGINRVLRAEMFNGTGTIKLSVVTETSTTEIEISVASADQEILTGTKAKNGKARLYVYADVKYADGTTERISSAWLVGLMNALNARKLAIVSNDENAEKIVATAPTTTTDDESSDESDDAE